MRTVDIRNTTNLTCEQQRLKWSSRERERAVQSVEGMARTFRLDLLARTNVAVGSNLPITSMMVRDAAWLLSRPKLAPLAYARQFKKPYELLGLPFC